MDWNITAVKVSSQYIVPILNKKLVCEKDGVLTRIFVKAN